MKTQKRLVMVMSFGLVALFAAGFAHAQQLDKPELIAPSGTIDENQPTYYWFEVENASSYFLTVKDSEENIILERLYPVQFTVCDDATGVCGMTPNEALLDGGYEWTIRAESSRFTPNESDPLSFTVEEGLEAASIKGNYAFTAMEQGGSSGFSGDSVVNEAGMGIVSSNQNGGMVGKISWNMWDSSTSSRKIFHRVPFVASYTLGGDGFGTMTLSVDLTQYDSDDMSIAGKLTVTKTKEKEALEFWFIADEPRYFGGGRIPIIHFFKREQ